MSTTKKLIKTAQRLLSNILQLGKRLTKQVMNWLLRNLFVFRRHPNDSQAGFVLPTVIMVMLVVTLLTTAILFRSFDRAKNASNVRINQATLSAATPALDRARAKINAVLADPTLPRGTPADSVIKGVIEDPNKYRFGDETQLVLSNSGDNRRSAWRFPVDTDNNGRFDSFTVYSILYETPQGLINPNSSASKTRTPLEARSAPMTTGSTDPACAAAEGTSASLVGTGGWVNVGGTLKKSFFVYVATVPITDSNVPGYNNNDYELYQKGNKGFSALELQADIPQVPLSNNAVVYKDDVEIFAGQNLTLNGRIFTNSNLFVFEPDNQNNPQIKFRQVSSPSSCFYEEVNSKIVAGGNVGYGYIALDKDNSNTRQVDVHLFQGKNEEPTTTGTTLSATNQSATGTPATMGYNNNAYEQRIAEFVRQAREKNLPQAVKDAIEEFETEDGLDNNEATEKALDRYFRERTRRVPYDEVPYGQTETIPNQALTGDGEDLRPLDKFMYPYDANGTTPTAANVSLNVKNNKLSPAATEFETQEQEQKENFIGDRVLLGNNLPELRYENGEWVGDEKPQEIQDIEWDKPAGEKPRLRKTRVTTLADAGDISRNGFWENAAADQPEDKYDPRGGLRVVTGAGVYLPDLAPGETLADHASTIVWPDWMPVVSPVGATGNPSPASEVSYLNNANVKSLTDINTEFPAPGLLNDYDSLREGLTPIEIDFVANPPEPLRKRPFLRMRAAAVYHYTHEEGEEPIACVATYYDPTNWRTARNLGGGGGGQAFRNTQDVSGDISLDATDTGFHVGGQPRTDNQGTGGSRSVNGITFQPPTLGNNPIIGYLRNQVYPNGRYVNPLLRKATDAGGNLTSTSLAETAAYHSTLCALQIYGKLSGALGLDSINPTDRPTGGYNLPHGTIRETAFLDARQIKAVDQGVSGDIQRPTGNYDFPIEQRYPLEIRATVLDLDKLRKATTPNSPYGDAEYLLPNSGIIYATRDDALADASDIEPVPPLSLAELTRDGSKPKLAATDFKLDPTRRPNGIMLINGAKLYRTQTFLDVEKGLTVASNLPVYIKAQPADNNTLEGFNPHQNNSAEPQQEFIDHQITPNSTDAQFYGRNVLNKNFACRKGDDRLPDCQGDEWRPATVLSDGITLLSSGFREGFRNEGDYDLRNHQIDTVDNFNEPPRIKDQLADPDGSNDPDGTNKADIFSNQTIAARRLWNGFWNNDFAINGLSSGISDLNYFPPATPNYPSLPSTPLNDTTPAAFPPGRGLTDDSYSTTTGAFNRTPGLPLNSSYFNNMVTPVQRRVPAGGFAAPEYVMEYCPKTLISECQPTDWRIGTVANSTRTSWEIFSTNYDTDGGSLKTSNDIPVSEFLSNPSAPTNSTTNLIAGTTEQPPTGAALGKPRRVAFLRDLNGGLIFDSANHPIPLGISTTGEVQPFPYNAVNNSNRLRANPNIAIPANVALINDNSTPAGLNLCATATRNPINGCTGASNLSALGNIQLPRNAPQGNALWYATVNEAPNRVAGRIFRMDFPLFYLGIADDQTNQTTGDGDKIYNEDGEALTTTDADGNWLNGQPLLVPVLQLQATTADQPAAPDDNRNHNNAGTVHWLPRAAVSTSPLTLNTTIFNLVMATKDSPSRPPATVGTHEGDIGGALSVLPRFLENWFTNSQSVQIDGSFIQIGRSSYATAPFYQLPYTKLTIGANANPDISLFKFPTLYRMGEAQRKQPAYEAPTRAWGFDVGLLSQIPDLFAQNFAIAPDEEPNLFYREVSRNDPWLEPLLCATNDAGDYVLPKDQRPRSCQ